MESGSKTLRLDREQVERISSLMLENLKETQGVCCLLIRRDGKILITHGNVTGLNLEDLGTLLAGSFATSREIAKLISEPEFTVLQNEGENKHILNILIDRDAILTTIYLKDADKKQVYETVCRHGASIADILSQNCGNTESDSASREERVDVDELESFTQSRLDTVFGEASEGQNQR